MTPRRRERMPVVARFLRHLVLVTAVWAAWSVGRQPQAAEPDRTPAAEAVAAAIDRGLDWLESRQQADGSWGSGGFRGSAAVTASCTMAFVGSGSTATSGSRAPAVARSVRYLLGCASGSGLIAGREQAAHGPMYGHAFATTALADLYGETVEDEAIVAVLDRAARLIERTQNDEGGWRYQPLRRDADLSVTAGMLGALRALRNAGIDVSETTVERAVDYVRSLQNGDGGFRYLTAAGPSAGPRTAAALLSLLAAAVDGPLIDRGFEWLDAHPIRLDEQIRLESGDGYALYGLFYSAAARRRRGGAVWEDWYPRTAAILLEAQRADGSWHDPSCAEYGTAAALAVLQMPADLVPFLRPEPSRPSEPSRP